MKYEIKPTGSGKIASALCQLCAPGELGETLVINGAPQAAVALFAAKLAELHYKHGRTPEQVAEAFELLSISNASALKQALASCSLQFEGEAKARSVGIYWETMGGTKVLPSLSILKL